MRLYTRNEILSCLSMMTDAHKLLRKKRGSRFERCDLLEQLLDMALMAGELIEEENGSNQEFEEPLNEYCQSVRRFKIETDKNRGGSALPEQMDRSLKQLRERLEAEEVTVKIAFLPYKYSMWDSLESIWEAAAADPACRCQVVPVPYYELDENGQPEAKRYEGAFFSPDVNIIDYQIYDLNEEKPDIVYIHNPYDDTNRVTRVESRFFSSEIKQSGCYLVYVPYYIPGYTENLANMRPNILIDGIVNSDYVILQSDMLKTAYQAAGIKPEKLIVTGSPKIDAVFKHTGQPEADRWRELAAGRKIILLNTSLHEMLQSENWLELVREMILEITGDQELYFIWRPHPLMQATVESMTPWNRQRYRELTAYVEQAENAGFDLSEDAFGVMACSDAMISDYSSLIRQYTFTGKPVLVLDGTSQSRSAVVYCDYFSNYFLGDGDSIPEFLAMVKEGKDERQKERLEYARRSVANPDGSCGIKTHQAIMKKVLMGARDERN